MSVQPTEGLVGGHRDGVLLFAFGEDLEEEFGAAAVEFHVAELVDDEQVNATVASDRLRDVFPLGFTSAVFVPAGPQSEVTRGVRQSHRDGGQHRRAHLPDTPPRPAGVTPARIPVEHRAKQQPAPDTRRGET